MRPSDMAVPLSMPSMVGTSERDFAVLYVALGSQTSDTLFSWSFFLFILFFFQCGKNTKNFHIHNYVLKNIVFSKCRSFKCCNK